MWYPAIDKRVLVKRAALLSDIRAFFQSKNVLEVEVPSVGATTVSDPHLTGLITQIGGVDHFLQTSPEFFMKRLLAAGMGSIFYLGKAFRQDEYGKRHNPEFSMLEWYHDEFDDAALADEVIELISALVPELDVERYSYRDIFCRYLRIDPHLAGVTELEVCARSIMEVQFDWEDKNTWLDVLFSHAIEPKLQNLTVIYDYPASQCALARVERDSTGVEVAKRFEVFWKGLELANGYWELTDPVVQRQRFLADQRVRANRDDFTPPIDDKLIAAMEHGLPDCAGVALGVDRLLMCLLNINDIRKVIAFPFDRL